MRVATVCPKCQHERKPGEDACARCGLLVARWAGFVVELPSVPQVDAAWQALQAEWPEPEAHRRFLEQASACDALDVAAARYRESRRERPGDDRGEEGFRRAVALADSLYAQKAQAARTKMPSGWLRAAGLVGALVVLSAALGLFFWALRVFRLPSAGG
jgi:hypothetical protein